MEVEGDTIYGLVSSGDRGRRLYNRILISLVTVAALLMVVLAVYRMTGHESLQVEAGGIMQLPSGAVVKKVVLGKGTAADEVWFQLPEPAGPGSQLSMIWALNGFPSPITFAPVAVTPLPGRKKPATPGISAVTAPVRRGDSISMLVNEMNKTTLSYDRASGWYHFEKVR